MISTSIILAALLGTPQSAVPAGPSAASEKPVCRWIEDPQWKTSRTKVCMAKADWDRDQRERRDDMDATLNRGTGDRRPY